MRRVKVFFIVILHLNQMQGAIGETKSTYGTEAARSIKYNTDREGMSEGMSGMRVNKGLDRIKLD